MAFDQTTRNRLARFVSDTRSLLAEEFTRQLQNDYGLDPNSGDVTELARLEHLDDARRETARLLRDTMEHYLASADTATPAKAKKARQDVLDRIVREQAFTILNRLCALRMAEARGLLIESIAKGYQSKGFQLYQRLAGTALGETGACYRLFIFSVFDEFAADLPVLFDRFSPQGRLFPREAALLSVLQEINHSDIDPLWAEDETIGWIYQYFNSVEERRQMRAASQAPRNSRELAVRNQFFTPRYVVEFLTDNTLGRIWYEMTKGESSLKDSCCYLVRRPNEIFLAEGEAVPDQDDTGEDLSQEELLKQPVHILHRPLKDPRDIKMLDPACGSMHFGLYAFDLFERIYEEAWEIEAQRGADGFVRTEGFKPLHESYTDKTAFLRDVPRLIIERNIHGIDIDPRAVQIAGLSLWLRAQRSWQVQNVKALDRPQIQRSNIVCAEPMPGEADMLEEFTEQLQPKVLGQLVKIIFEKMQLAGEAGSLLKIEEEIKDAVNTAHAAYQKHLLDQQKDSEFLPGMAPKRKAILFDFADLPKKEDFWSRAEMHVLTALENYAEHAHGVEASRRRMFVRDAAQGFSFVDLCRHRYEAVVMNPPFGLAPRQVFNQIKLSYVDTYVDLYASFVARGINLAPNGIVGAITSRAFLMTKKLDRWRINQLVPSIELLIDLGIGVMDDAFVEAGAYVLRGNNPIAHILASNRRHSEYKSGSLIASNSHSVYVIDRREIMTLPGAKLLYQLPPAIFSLLRSPYSFEPYIGTAREGLRTFDDFRFLRLRWEAPLGCIGPDQQWEPLAKGGEYARYYSDIHLLVKWNGDGHELAAENINVNGQIAQSRQASDYYRRSGVTYSKRSAKGFSARALPAGCIIGTKGPAVLSESDVDQTILLGWLNCDLIKNLIHIQANAYEFNTGIIKRLPWKVPGECYDLGRVAMEAVLSAREVKRIEETNSCFESPTIGACIDDISYKINQLSKSSGESIAKCDQLWNEAMSVAYGVELDAIDEESDDGLDEVSDEDFELEGETSSQDQKQHIACSLVGYSVGCAFGRWDVRKAIAETPSCIPGPFDKLPLYPPGMFLDANGIPVCAIFKESIYPFEPLWSGITCGDRSGSAFATAVRSVFDVVWGSRSSEVEHDIMNYLGGSLEDYLNSPNGFFDYHLGTYSKSRRYAPIYWPLSTPSGSYTIWLYYHRLTDQTLYTCVNDFVDPKLKQVSDDTASLRSKSNRSSAEEKELERLSDLELELKDFRDELLRIARFWKPNLNDGVQITAAPLWNLFQHRQWKARLKDTWEKLEAGDYDWAHLALSIWPDRVVRASHKDRSYAIAHDLEDVLWHEVEVEKVGRGGRVTRTTEWQSRNLSSADLQRITTEVKAR